MAIQFLPPEIVHRIAAGEVIDSLAAVVRELVENSLDAQASRISLGIWPEQWRVQVVDNGLGLGAADLAQAALAHSTSKFPQKRLNEASVNSPSSRLGEAAELAMTDWAVTESAIAELSQIHSLGFRGEALHSLARLSRLSLCSRPPDQSEGLQLSYGNDGQPQGEPLTLALAPGTVVTVEDLFAAWPSRRQAMPHPAQQLRAIQRLIQGIALAHPQVTWQLSQNDRPWFSLWPGPSAQALLPQMLRGVDEADLRQVRLSLGKDMALTLLLGLPDRCHRHRPDWVKVCVNGRCVRLPELEQTLLGAMRRSLRRDRFPIAFIQLQAPPEQVDWNRHPAKAELYLHQLPRWQAALAEAVVQALRLGPEEAELGGGDRVQALFKAAEQGAGYGLQRQVSQTSPALTPAVDLSQTDERPPAIVSRLKSGSSIAPGSAIELGSQAEAGSQTESGIQPTLLKALAQVHRTYIVAEHPAGLWLVEQHIAHERVLYEQICDRWSCIPLQPPVILENLSPRQQAQLERIGVELAPFGEGLWVARSAPALLAQRQDCSTALLELSLGGDLQTAQVATACRSAIRNGTALSLGEMQRLLDQWQRTRQPRTCPHGRPIYMALAETSLARFFRRHWVIGKSHGI